MGTKYNSVFGKLKLRKRYICCIFSYLLSSTRH
nr:MAG TPA: hypothetical protein [Caudoviricetes sp.]